MKPENVFVMKRGVPQEGDAIVASPRYRMAGFASSVLVPKTQIGAREMRALDALEEIEVWPDWLDDKKEFVWLETSRYEKNGGQFDLIDKSDI